MFIFTCSYRGVLHIENVRESYNSTIVYSNSEKQTEIARRETSTSPLASLIVFTRCVPADYPQRQSQCPKTRVVREYRELLLSHLHRSNANDTLRADIPAGRKFLSREPALGFFLLFNRILRIHHAGCQVRRLAGRLTCSKSLKRDRTTSSEHRSSDRVWKRLEFGR